MVQRPQWSKDAGTAGATRRVWGRGAGPDGLAALVGPPSDGWPVVPAAPAPLHCAPGHIRRQDGHGVSLRTPVPGRGDRRSPAVQTLLVRNDAGGAFLVLL